MKVLKDQIHPSTRYSRSIQLERDIDALDITEGYIPTPRSLSALRRVQDSLLQSGSSRAFTITAVYGTGKSAFAQFLATLLGGRDENRKIARSVLHACLHRSSGPTSIATTNEKIKTPFAIGVVAASREPLVFTLLAALRSALDRGVGFELKRIPALLKSWHQAQKAIRTSHDSLEHFHSLLTEITRATEGGLVLILDEFGKNLEYAVQNSASAGSDIYLLQQLAELREIEGKPVGLITLLHQSFTEYGDDLTREQRAEWAKIQGRFEDLPLQESELNALPLLAAAMRHDKEIMPALKQRASVSHKAFQKLSGELPSFASLSERILAGLLPLHPVTARLLPALSARYAQNERSVFTFLTGPEGLAFPQFLSESNVADLQTFRPARLFDYFSESMGSTISMQAGYSRFLEVQDIIKDAQFLPPLHLEILKTIGTLNLLSTSGDLRAGKELVILSAMNDPDDAALRKEIVAALEELKKKGLVHYRAGADEFRLWHGTLFDVDEGIKKERARGNLATSAILNEKFPFAPVVAQRHSFQTGTLRYFFRIFWDGTIQPFSELKAALEDEKMCDGFVVYSLNPEKEIHNENNFYLADGRPVVLITSKDVGKLNHELEHYASLVRLAEENVDLRRDKLALREVNARLRISEEAIHSLLAKVYDLASRGVEANMFYLFDKQEALSDLDKKSKAKNGNDKNTRKYIEKRGLGALLSHVCDAAYNLNYNKPGKNKQFHYSLKNELINRREIGSGISKAIRLLAEAMLKNPQAENFGLEGNGPEVTIYRTLFSRSGLHMNDVAGAYKFETPDKKSGLPEVFTELEEWCKSQSDEPAPLLDIYQRLLAPPFGMREPVLPLLLLAVLLKYPETMNLYREGSFVPVLNIETFEILMRRPEKFAIKFFKLDGLKETFFAELEKAFFTGNLSPTYREASQNMGRSGLMKVIRPLVKNVAHLPRYTRNTKSISVEAQNLLKTILAAREPDALLFRDLPIALGLPLVSLKQSDSEKARILSRKTLETLKELEDAYPRLLRQIRAMLCEAFQEKQEAELKSRLNVLGSTLVDRVIEPELKRFVRAAAESHLDETAWLESVAMVIADKPTHAWQDTDLAVFEARLGEISRRILNLEVILAEARRRNDGAFDARLLTLTSTDGSELRGALLVPEDKTLKKRAEALLADHPDLLSDEKLRAAVLLLLTEKTLGKGESAPSDHAKNHVNTRDA